MPDRKVAIVTGASRGIGLAVVRALLAADHRVVATGRDAIRLEESISSLEEAEEDVLAIEADVSSEAAVRSTFEHAFERFGRVDVVVNNAGTALVRSVTTTTLEEWSDLLAIHATGTFLMCREAVERMSGGGRIVNVSSVSARAGAALGTAYSAAKAAVLGFTRALAREVAAKAITVNAVCPGAVDTQMFRQDTLGPLEKLYGRDRETLLRGTLAAIPQHRLLEPSEVADLIVYLASEAARGITGQTFTICGGFDIHG